MVDGLGAKPKHAIRERSHVWRLFTPLDQQTHTQTDGQTDRQTDISSAQRLTRSVFKATELHACTFYCSSAHFISIALNAPLSLRLHVEPEAIRDLKLQRSENFRKS